MRSSLRKDSVPFSFVTHLADFVRKHMLLGALPLPYFRTCKVSQCIFCRRLFTTPVQLINQMVCG